MRAPRVTQRQPHTLGKTRQARCMVLEAAIAGKQGNDQAGRRDAHSPRCRRRAGTDSGSCNRAAATLRPLQRTQHTTTEKPRQSYRLTQTARGSAESGIATPGRILEAKQGREQPNKQTKEGSRERTVAAAVESHVHAIVSHRCSTEHGTHNKQGRGTSQGQESRRSNAAAFKGKLASHNATVARTTRTKTRR